MRTLLTNNQIGICWFRWWWMELAGGDELAFLPRQVMAISSLNDNHQNRIKKIIDAHIFDNLSFQQLVW